MTEFCVGEPVPAADLWFRNEFIELTWEELANGHAVLVGARRTGKTSVMHHLRDRPTCGWEVIYLDAEDLRHPSELLESLLQEFQRQHPETSSTHQAIVGWIARRVSWLMGRLDSIEAATLLKVELRKDASWRKDWKEHGQSLLDKIREVANKTLIVVDEFPDLINNISKTHQDTAAEFLNWFRSQRMSPAPRCDCIRWLVGGSINLISSIDRLGCSGVMNDCRILELPILASKEVKQFFERMLRGHNVSFSPDSPIKFVERLGRPIPFFMQAIAQQLCRDFARHGRLVDAQAVDQAFDGLIDNPAAKDKLRHYRVRLEKYYSGTRLKTAQRLLQEMSHCNCQGHSKVSLLAVVTEVLRRYSSSEDGLEASELLGDLLRDLENEFYIVECQTGHYDFASGILKQWWRKYYG